MSDFEIVESTRNFPENKISLDVTRGLSNKSKERLVDAISDNMPNIINCANTILEIGKMQVQGQIELAKMDKAKEMLLAETNAYCQKLEAKSKTHLDKMDKLRLLLKDFYESNNGTISGEEFSNILSTVLK